MENCFKLWINPKGTRGEYLNKCKLTVSGSTGDNHELGVCLYHSVCEDLFGPSPFISSEALGSLEVLLSHRETY